jgi:hypothetical protein
MKQRNLMVRIVSIFGFSRCELCYNDKANSAKILELPEERIDIKAIEELTKLEEKAHNVILLSLLDRVLREIADEETTARLWKKLESLYMNKSLTNRLYLKQRLYTFKMKEDMPLCDHLDNFNRIMLDLKDIILK